MRFHLGRLIDHVHLKVRDLERSMHFYRSILAPLGLADALIKGKGNFHVDELWIEQTDGAVSHTHLAFQARNEAVVRAFYQVALLTGGADNGPPGFRSYHPSYYAAFVIDPDGNNVEAVFHGAAERSADSVTFRPLRSK